MGRLLLAGEWRRSSVVTNKTYLSIPPSVPGSAGPYQLAVLRLLHLIHHRRRVIQVSRGVIENCDGNVDQICICIAYNPVLIPHTTTKYAWTLNLA